MSFRIKNLLRLFLIAIIIVISVVIFLNQLISWSSNKYIYDDINELPDNNVALVLGTSKFRKDGAANKYFYNRINAAVKLYENNKINYIIASGDNRTIYYNEPGVMRQELLKQGVPDSIIYLDYAGFRTFDSVIRCHKVFGQNNFTIVSQRFHNQRAVYIARSKNIEAIAFNAKNMNERDGLKMRIREIFARVKVFIDLIIGTQPKFLGHPVNIQINE